MAIFITTDKVYENKESIWGYREGDQLGGYDPYSSSKACCEILVNSYRESYFNSNNYNNHKKSIATVRAGNIIGGGDWAKNRIIPDLVRGYESGDIVKIRNSESVRPWQYVLDALNGYILLAEKMYLNEGEYCEAWNFGPNTIKFYKVKDIVKEINKITGNKINIQYGNDMNFHETSLLWLDITKSLLKLNWKPTLTFKEAIAMTMELYSNYKKENVGQLSIKQINDFIKKVK